MDISASHPMTILIQPTRLSPNLSPNPPKRTTPNPPHIYLGLIVGPTWSGLILARGRVLVDDVWMDEFFEAEERRYI